MQLLQEFWWGFQATVHASHFALMLSVALVAVWWLVVRAVRKRDRGDAFRCAGCWYALDGLPGDAVRCPECGGRLSAVGVRRSGGERRRQTLLWAWCTAAVALPFVGFNVFVIAVQAPPIGSVHEERVVVRYPSPPGGLPELVLTSERVHRGYDDWQGRRWLDATNRRNDALLDFRCTLRAGDEELDLAESGVIVSDVRAWVRRVGPSLSEADEMWIALDVLSFAPISGRGATRLAPSVPEPAPIDRTVERRINGKRVGPGLRTRGLYGRPTVVYASWWHAHNAVVMGLALLLTVGLAAYAPLRAHRLLRGDRRAWGAR